MPVHAHIPASHRWMTVEEAAKHFGVVPMRVRVWIMDGNIPVDPKRGVLLADLLKQRAAEARTAPAPTPAPVHVRAMEPSRAMVPAPEPALVFSSDARPSVVPAAVSDAWEPPPDSGRAKRILLTILKYVGLFLLVVGYQGGKFVVMSLFHFTIRVVSLLIGFVIGFLLFRRLR